MQDEHFIRDWNAGHARFSADLDQAVRQEARQLRKFVDFCSETALARKARLTGAAVVTGFAAGVGFAALMLVVAAMAAPETSHAAIACTAAAPLA